MAPDYRELRQRARKMRKNPTRAERILWGKLRKRRLAGAKFRRQHILTPYIVDFYCVSAKLAVEVDGGVHVDSESIEKDNSRDDHLREAHGVEVVRFSTHALREELDDVLNTLETLVEQLITTDAPPPTTT